MNQSKIKTFWPLFFCGALLVSAAQKPKPAAAAPHPAEAPPLAAAPMARVITYGDQDVIPVKTKLRYTTLIILPKAEKILDFTCGDKEFWAVEGNANFAYVKPAKAEAATNLNLVTASGNIYSFLLSEVSADPKAEPDFKVFIELKEDGMRAAAQDAPKFVSAQDLIATKAELESARQQEQQTKQASSEAINNGIRQFVSNVRFAYRFEAGKHPFNIRAMYHDDRFTYIQARPEETPTLYEIKDGQPNLVNFQYKDGVYVVEKILDKGYLAIGKQKLAFTREE